ncbi:hypothetical protein EYZ11_005701 [Aspergillus tanneri]|uniref:Uncharacterized protein n=1 Tax=Aspergillus tanneri TaxID=1220188 RepID=A0A4S3JHB6_9EURO|nr:hypothetical protein EYZ11_005701 [Aspergillus tanneri]
MADLSKEPCYKAYLHKGAKGEIDWPEYNEETFEVDDGDGNTKTITGVVIYPREVFCRVEDCPSGSYSETPWIYNQSSQACFASWDYG